MSPTTKPIRIFLSSPGDVIVERTVLSGIVSEINLVLQYLVSDLGLTLELVRYETHTYPDIGQAQAVINRQIPVDYDIFIGVMWRRCGTPTDNADSGTVEEFDRALAKREATGLPTIMFYFCDEQVPFPKSREEIEQLGKVMSFRESISQRGLVVVYPSREAFPEHVRQGLLGAVRDLVRSRRISGDTQASGRRAAFDNPELRHEIEQLAKGYDNIRQAMPSGWDRTAKLLEYVAAMRLQSASVRALLPELKSSASPGERLAAICILQQFPASGDLDWIAERLDPDRETAFVGYQAAMALVQAVRSLEPTFNDQLDAAIQKALTLAERNPNDPPRLNLLRSAKLDIEVKKRSGQLKASAN